MLKQKKTTVDTEFCSQELTAAETNGNYKNRGRIMYYKDHSADWWHKAGISGYGASLLLSSTAAMMMYLPLEREQYNFSLALLGIFLAFAAVIVQMVIQWLSGNYLRNSLYAQKGVQNVHKTEIVKYRVITLWTWAADFAVLTVIYGAAFAHDPGMLIYLLPCSGGIFLILLIIASVLTAKTKK